MFGVHQGEDGFWCLRPSRSIASAQDGPRWAKKSGSTGPKCHSSRDTPEVPWELPAHVSPRSRELSAFLQCAPLPALVASPPILPQVLFWHSCVPVPRNPLFLWALSLAHWHRVRVPFLSSCFHPVSPALCWGHRQTFRTYLSGFSPDFLELGYTTFGSA